MIENPNDRQRVVDHIGTEVYKLQRLISKPVPSDAESKDAAVTWWYRGQIKALEQLQGLLDNKDS